MLTRDSPARSDSCGPHGHHVVMSSAKKLPTKQMDVVGAVVVCGNPLYSDRDGLFVAHEITVSKEIFSVNFENYFLSHMVCAQSKRRLCMIWL